MEYLLMAVVLAIFGGSHYGFSWWARKIVDPDHELYDIPFPLWVHAIIAIPSITITFVISYALIKALT
jgi:hypothetical protein